MFGMFAHAPDHNFRVYHFQIEAKQTSNYKFLRFQLVWSDRCDNLNPGSHVAAQLYGFPQMFLLVVISAKSNY